MRKLHLCIAFALACGGGSATGGGEGSSGGEEEEHHEAHDLSAYEGPLDASADASAGAEVFATFCEGCHPGGHEGIGDDLHTSGDSLAEARWIIREGEGRMPGFNAGTISDEDLENVLAHLQTYGMFQ
ncbi:MAG: cytochrome c [Myxococcota bacterium]